MVIGAFPVAKLGGLLVKQISKPIANYIKYQAKSSPVFRTYICMPPAQFYNWCEVKTKMWVLNLGKPINIPVLNEAMAIDLGANLLGEAIIFIIGGGAMIFEYNRSVRKEAAKEQAKQDEMNAMNTELQELFFHIEEQRVQIKELQRIILDLETQVVKKPWAGSKTDKPDDKAPSPPAPPNVSSPNQAPNVSIISQPLNDFSGAKPGNLLLRAVHIVENDFLANPESQKKDVGILTIALNHLYNDVYRWPNYVLI